MCTLAWHFGKQDGTYYHPPSADCRASIARSTACWSHLDGVNQVFVLFLGRMLLALVCLLHGCGVCDEAREEEFASLPPPHSSLSGAGNELVSGPELEGM